MRTVPLAYQHQGHHSHVVSDIVAAVSSRVRSSHADGEFAGGVTPFQGGQEI